jgi:hypothetical protein
MKQEDHQRHRRRRPPASRTAPVAQAVHGGGAKNAAFARGDAEGQFSRKSAGPGPARGTGQCAPGRAGFGSGMSPPAREPAMQKSTSDFRSL